MPNQTPLKKLTLQLQYIEILWPQSNPLTHLTHPPHPSGFFGFHSTRVAPHLVAAHPSTARAPLRCRGPSAPAGSVGRCDLTWPGHLGRGRRELRELHGAGWFGNRDGRSLQISADLWSLQICIYLHPNTDAAQTKRESHKIEAKLEAAARKNGPGIWWRCHSQSSLKCFLRYWLAPR